MAINARYIRIRMLIDHTFMCIGDIKAFSNDCNIALYKNVTTTQIYNNSGQPGDVVDGTKNTFICLDAISGVFPTITVDLGSIQPIDYLEIRKPKNYLSYFVGGNVVEMFTDLISPAVFSGSLNVTNSTETFQFAPIPTPTNATVTGQIVKLRSTIPANYIWVNDLEIYVAGINIAPGKQIKSSPIYGKNIAANAIDGIGNTYAVTDRVHNVNSFITIDLGGLHVIEKIVYRKKLAPSINKNIVLEIFETDTEQKKVFSRDINDTDRVETIEDFTYEPPLEEQLRDDLDALETLVASLVPGAPLSVSPVNTLDVNGASISTLLNDVVTHYEFTFLNNTRVDGLTTEIELLGTGLTPSEAGLKRTFFHNSKKVGALPTENYIRIRINKTYFQSPDIIPAPTYYVFELRNVGQSFNLVWSGTKWFVKNTSNALLTVS